MWALLWLPTTRYKWPKKKNPTKIFSPLHYHQSKILFSKTSWRHCVFKWSLKDSEPEQHSILFHSHAWTGASIIKETVNNYVVAWAFCPACLVSSRVWMQTECWKHALLSVCKARRRLQSSAVFPPGTQPIAFNISFWKRLPRQVIKFLPTPPHSTAGTDLGV